MKQGVLRGFGSSYLSGATPPVDMPYEVLLMCHTEADAIKYSIQYAKRRFGYRQIDIARMCGWSSDNHLSAYKSNPDVLMPESRRARFAQVTGCNLLEQFERAHASKSERKGSITNNQRDELAVALMLRAA